MNKVIVLDKLSEVSSAYLKANDKEFELTDKNIKRFVFENLFLNNRYYEYEV